MPTAGLSSIRSPFGASDRPAPTSVSCRVCSYTRTSIPARAAAAPPIPPPITTARGVTAHPFPERLEAEGVVDGAVGHREQDQIVISGDHLTPGPGRDRRDRRYVVGKEREGPAAAAQCPGPAGHALVTELAVSRHARVRALAARSSSRQPRVARAGPPVTGLRYSRLAGPLLAGARAISRFWDGRPAAEPDRDRGEASGDQTGSRWRARRSGDRLFARESTGKRM